MKLKLLILALGAAILGAGAVAAPVPALPSGPLYIKFDNREQIASVGTTGYAYAPDEINWGVITLSTMNPGVVTGLNTIETTGSAFFNNILSGGQITGMFYGIEGLAAGTGGNPFPATSGFMDLYYRDLSTMTTTDLASSLPGIRCGFDCATGFTQGTLLAHLEFASGINTLDASVFINGSVVPSSGSGFAGLATSYANIIAGAGGAYESALNTDYFTTPFGTRDLRFRNIYEELTAWNGDLSGCTAGMGNCVLGARSTDPATAYVPEPGSLALLGLGLVGLAASRRRRDA